MTTALAVTRLELPALSDQELGNYLAGVSGSIDDLRDVKFGIEREIERRLNATGAKALAHPAFEKIELVEQFTPYVADPVALKLSVALLKGAGRDEEAVKVAKYVPEETTIVAAHWDAGNPRSIHALIEKYGAESDIGQALSRCLTRQSLGTKLTVKARPALPGALREIVDELSRDNAA